MCTLREALRLRSLRRFLISGTPGDLQQKRFPSSVSLLAAVTVMGWVPQHPTGQYKHKSRSQLLSFSADPDSSKQQPTTRPRHKLTGQVSFGRFANRHS